MFAQFLKKSNFYERYMQLYAARQALANLQMEDSTTDILSPSRTQEMFNSIIAFENVLHRNPEKIGPYDLIDIAADINTGIYNKGFRKTQVEVKKAQNFYPPAPYEIQGRIYSLFDSYHKIWFDQPIYEKEARLHIELVRLQPFEDGNKRSTRVLTNFNLIKQNKAPVIISGVETDEYFSYIDDYNVDKMAELLQNKSEQEFEIMMELYRSLCGEDFDEPLVNLEKRDVKTLIMAKRLIEDIGKITKKEKLD